MRRPDQRQTSRDGNDHIMRDSKENRSIKMAIFRIGHSKPRDGAVEVVAVTGWAETVAIIHRSGLVGSP